MTPNDFVLNFPEFRDTDPLLIAAKLNMAARRMGGPDQAIWGGFNVPTPAVRSAGPTTPGGPTAMSTADMAQGLYAAHLLITNPFGTEMRLVPGNGKSSYLEQFEELEQAVCGGFLTAGVG